MSNIEIGVIEPIDGDYIGIMVNIANQFAVVVPVYFNLSLYNVSCSSVGRYGIGYDNIQNVSNTYNAIIVRHTGTYASDTYNGHAGIAKLSFTKKN